MQFMRDILRLCLNHQGEFTFRRRKIVYYYYLLLTAIELSLGGNSPYTSTDKTNKNKYT